MKEIGTGTPSPVPSKSEDGTVTGEAASGTSQGRPTGATEDCTSGSCEGCTGCLIGRQDYQFAARSAAGRRNAAASRGNGRVLAAFVAAAAYAEATTPRPEPAKPVSPTANPKPKAGGKPPPDPRETMRVLPQWLQPLLTEITGKAPAGEKASPHWTPAGRMTATVFVFLAAIVAGVLAVHLGGGALLVLPVAWLLTVSSVRVFQTALVHHASHGRLLPNPFWNDLIGEALSLVAWISPLSVYRGYHNKHHSGLGSSTDPDLKFIASLGLKPGLSVAAYWRRFWLTLVSPVFHARYLAARLRENFLLAPTARRMAAVGFATLLAAAVVLTGCWAEFLLGYLLPITVLTQMSAWAGLLGLHQWVPDPAAASKREAIASLTGGRFVGKPVPAAGAGLRAWACWGGRMLTWHLFQRLAVVPGDLPSHDWHHVRPVTWDWADHAYARRDSLVSMAGWPAAPKEYWGVGSAIQATFERLAALPPGAQLGEPLTPEERRGVLASM